MTKYFPGFVNYLDMPNDYDKRKTRKNGEHSRERKARKDYSENYKNRRDSSTKSNNSNGRPIRPENVKDRPRSPPAKNNRYNPPQKQKPDKKRAAFYTPNIPLPKSANFDDYGRKIMRQPNPHKGNPGPSKDPKDPEEDGEEPEDIMGEFRAIVSKVEKKFGLFKEKKKKMDESEPLRIHPLI